MLTGVNPSMAAHCSGRVSRFGSRSHRSVAIGIFYCDLCIHNGVSLNEGHHWPGLIESASLKNNVLFLFVGFSNHSELQQMFPIERTVHETDHVVVASTHNSSCSEGVRYQRVWRSSVRRGCLPLAQRKNPRRATQGRKPAPSFSLSLYAQVDR
jgi:hypothetical protein